MTFRVESLEGQRINRLVVTMQPWERPRADDGDEDAA
jgi:hypothetical protein